MIRLLGLPLLLAAGAAQACLFVKDVPPQQWYDWSVALFAGEVTGLAQEAGKVDVITVRVGETFKGPRGETATLRVPSRMWSSCRMALPALGDRVLVALNAHHDSALVPLSPEHVAVLRARRTNGAPGGANGASPARE